jgi:phosphoribosylanthranilate isomerase
MNHRTRIKICGVCRPEDAEAAAAAGADALGLVFHPTASRCVTVERAREILSAVPAFVTPVGVFVNVSASEVRDVAGRLGLRHVQLNGEEPPAVVAELAGLAVIKAIRVDRDQFGQTLDTWRRAVRSLALSNLKGLVLETAGTGRAGGTGVPNDWETVLRHRAAGDFVGLPPVIAAGGLTPETVGDVVRTVHPWAVDVSSGVEETRGQKSAAKLRAFVEAVRRADESQSSRTSGQSPSIGSSRQTP